MQQDRLVRPQRWRMVATLTVACLMVAACGSRRSHDELVAEAIALAGNGGVTVDTVTGGIDGASSDGGTSSGGAIVTDGGGTTTGTGGAPSGGGGATDGGTTGGPAAQQCTGDEPVIRIGSIGTQSGVIGGFLSTGPLAVQAWASAINDRGGLNCRQVELTIADDGGDPSRHQALVRRLVEQDGVIAIVHATAVLTGQASVSYLTEKGIPVIGSEGGSSWFYESPVYRPQTSTGSVAARGAYATASILGAPDGLTRIGTVACVEASFCTVAGDLAPGAAADFGLQHVFSAQASLVQPDFTSVCQRANGAGAQILVVFMDPNAISRLRRNCTSVGYEPIIETGGPLAGEGLLSDPSLDGTWLTSSNLVPSASDNPTVAEFQSVMSQFAPGVAPDGAAFNGFLSAKMFEAAALIAGDDLTPAGMLRGLAGLGGNDLGGATMPLAFTLGQNAPPQLCIFPAIVRDGVPVAAGGSTRTCF